MDDIELAQSIFGVQADTNRVNSSPSMRPTPTNTTTISGIAVASSEEGYVDVNIDGEIVELETVVSVVEDQDVIISITNHTPVVTGVIGWGDEIKASKLDIDLLNADVAWIDEGHIADAAIETAMIGDAQITNAKIGDLSAEKITSGNIDTDRLTANVVTAINSYTGSAVIDDAKIGDLSADKITTGTFSANRIDTVELAAQEAFLGALVTDNFFADKALLTDAIIDQGWVTDLMVKGGLVASRGTYDELVGLQISGDKVIANTLRADTLILKGLDGIYRAINIDELGQTTVEGDEDSFTLTNEQPSDFTTNYSRYFTRSGSAVSYTFTRLTQPRTWTADTFYLNKYESGVDGSAIVANSVTAAQITTENIQGVGGWINLSDGTFLYQNSESANSDYISWNGTDLDISSRQLRTRFEGIESTFASKVDVSGVQWQWINSVFNGQGNQAALREMGRYIKFLGGKIFIYDDSTTGLAKNKMYTVIQNGRISFIQGGIIDEESAAVITDPSDTSNIPIEVAYISDGRLYVVEAQMTKRVQLGDIDPDDEAVNDPVWQIESRGSGNGAHLTFSWIG